MSDRSLDQMPCLPSGLHFALDPAPLRKLVERSIETPQVHELMAIEDMEDLLPHIGIAFFRPKQASMPIQKFADNSEIPPQDLEPYPSGYNLLSIRKAFETWSTEDQRAFEEFLDEPRMTDFFENCLDEVQHAQDSLLSQPETLPGLLATFWEAGCHPLQEEELDEEHPQTNQGNGISHARDYSINPVMGIWNELDPKREAKPEFLAFLDGLLTFRPGTLGQVDLDQGTNRIERREDGRPKTFVHYYGYAHEPVLRLLHRHLGKDFSVMDVPDRFGIGEHYFWEEDFEYPGPYRPDWLEGIPFYGATGMGGGLDLWKSCIGFRDERA